MGRSPCCDKVGIKKGPWTPEEDIILVSYIQEHGPGNWRSVPTDTGLLRCSKSCRLRWTNYLRPGIKRGNFTAHEEGMIIHLQALLGNKWAAIASYLPQRTDNDIKNYWNTHLKKRLEKIQSASSDSTFNCHFSSKSSTPIASRLSHASSTYASSTENISRLLEGWMRASPKPNQQKLLLHQDKSFAAVATMVSSTNHHHQLTPQSKANDEGVVDNAISREELDSILSFENMSNCMGSYWDKSSLVCDKSDDGLAPGNERKPKTENSSNHPLTFLEKWLLDETFGTQVEEIMQLSPPPMF